MVFRDQLTALGFSTYADYLNGPHWQEFRDLYRKSGLPRKCAACSGKPIQLHHHTYERLGAELLTDVTPLCRECHGLVHAILKEKRWFVQRTADVIAILRATAKNGNSKPVTTRRQKQLVAQARNEQTFLSLVKEFSRLSALFPTLSRPWQWFIKEHKSRSIRKAIRNMRRWETVHGSEAAALEHRRQESRKREAICQAEQQKLSPPKPKPPKTKPAKPTPSQRTPAQKRLAEAQRTTKVKRDPKAIMQRRCMRRSKVRPCEKCGRLSKFALCPNCKPQLSPTPMAQPLPRSPLHL